MTLAKSALSGTAETLRKFALGYPEAQEGVSCAGTSLERATVNARNKAFVFLGDGEARLKLGESLEEATRLASREPERYRPGSKGWVQVTLGPGEPPLDLLQRWIDESYRLLAAKQLVARLPESGLAPAE
jgi:predicted DNA-binding protein (MmcQ/YjbR family)